MDQLMKSEGRRTTKVAIYARVSTANNGQDPTMQTRELREYAERRGWTVAGDYVDRTTPGVCGRPDVGLRDLCLPGSCSGYNYATAFQPALS